MASAAPQFVFGKSIKVQLAENLKGFIRSNFETESEAAASLGIGKQRLNSYTHAKSLPGADLIDEIRRKWKFDPITGESVGREKVDQLAKDASRGALQLNLFDQPVTLSNDQLTVSIQRKGQGLEVRLRVSQHARIA